MAYLGTPFGKTKTIFDILHQSRTYSLKRRIVGYSIIAVIFILISTIIIGSYYSSLLVQNAYQSQQDMLNNYNVQLTHELSAAESCLITYANDHIDVGMLTTLDKTENVLPYRVRVHNLFSTTLTYMSHIDGLFIYAPKTDSWVCNCGNVNDYPLDEYLKLLLRGSTAEELADNYPLNRWFFVTVKGEYYLLRIIPSAYCYSGAWVRLDTLTESLTNLSTYTTSFYFIADDGTPLLADDETDGIFAAMKPIEHSGTQQLTGKDGKKYLAVTSSLSFCDYYITALISMHDIHASMMSVYWGLLLSGIALLVLVSFLLFSLTHFIRRPLAALRQTSAQLHQGNFDTRLCIAEEPCTELREVDTAINTLLDEIEHLRIHIYEEQLARTEFELQYLKSQIAPHFLINCFQTLYALPKTADGQALTQRMIQTLSDHLRYTLNTQSRVPLSRELHYVKNYIELTKIRFPDCVTYECSVEPLCEDASVFPMILLMLTENTIKYNLVMGEPLILRIAGHSFIRDDVRYIHLTHIDSGDGFSGEHLDKLNRLHEFNSPPTDGNHVGLYNVLKRMDILYYGQGSIVFSNEPQMGARIDIEVPYESYHPADDETKGKTL